MKILELPGSNVCVYIRETPNELPINRFTDFQKYLIQAAGIGSKVSDVENHFKKLLSFLQSGQVDNAARETYNLIYNIHLNLNKIDIDSFAFLSLIDQLGFIDRTKKSTDKDFTSFEKVTDYSEESLRRLSTRLGEYGLTKLMVLDIINEVKKKSIED